MGSARNMSADVYILPKSDYNGRWRDLITADRSQAFGMDITEDIITLQKSYDSANRNYVRGLLYTPSLPSGHICQSSTIGGYIPPNATRVSDMNGFALSMIAIAPWTNKECATAFLENCFKDNVDTKAFLFYPESPTLRFPAENTSFWDIQYSQWKFPVFAVNHTTGRLLMDQVADYSGDVTTVWDRPLLAEQFPEGFPRLHLKVHLEETKTSIPGLWVFILIVVGILLFIVGAVSLIMHVLHYRRRQAALVSMLRSGATGNYPNGLRLPQELLETYPVITYAEARGEHCRLPSTIPAPDTSSISTSAPPSPIQPAASTSTLPSPSRSIDLSSRRANAPTQIAIPPPTGITYAAPSPPLPPSPVITRPPPLALPSAARHFTEPQCPICLDDYIATTSVRLLPCNHYFHPSCIDRHLLDNSSFCPVCKTNLLPPHYIAKLKARGMRLEMRAVRDQELREEGLVRNAFVQAVFPGARVPDFVLRRRQRESGDGDMEAEMGEVGRVNETRSESEVEPRVEIGGEGRVSKWKKYFRSAFSSSSSRNR